MFNLIEEFINFRKSFLKLIGNYFWLNIIVLEKFISRQQHTFLSVEMDRIVVPYIIFHPSTLIIPLYIFITIDLSEFIVMLTLSNSIF